LESCGANLGTTRTIGTSDKTFHSRGSQRHEEHEWNGAYRVTGSARQRSAHGQGFFEALEWE
jgi:hypothetical protein